MSWKSRDFPLQYRDFLHLKSGFPHLKSNFPHTKSNFSQSAFYFLQWLSAFFNGFPLSSTAFRFLQWISDFLQWLSDFPRNPRKSIYGDKYTKDHYLSFVFFATRSPSFIISRYNTQQAIVRRQQRQQRWQHGGSAGQGV